MASTKKSARPVAQQRSAEWYWLRIAQRLALLMLNRLAPSSTPVVARGTTATKAKTTNAANYTVDGKPAAQKAATDDLWTFTGAVLAAGSFRKYLLCLDAAGTASVLASTDATTAAADCQYPSASLPDGVCVIGWVIVATDATHPFTPGTTALNATGITATFADGFDPALLPVLQDPQGNILNFE